MLNINSEYNLISTWLKEYHLTKNNLKKTKLKGLIVTCLLPIVKRIAKTIARRSYDPIEDLTQAGCIGLLKAIDSYNIEKNTNFKTYSGYFIIGEMKHYLRDKLNTIRVPRHIQELSYRMNCFINSLSAEELAKLTNEQCAEVLNVKPKDVEFVQQIDRRKNVLSLEDLYNANTDNLSFEEVISDSQSSEDRNVEDFKIIINDVITKLPDNLKKLVELYYYEDMNQKEIAENLNLSQMQVSRGLKKAYSILYKLLADK